MILKCKAAHIANSTYVHADTTVDIGEKEYAELPDTHAYKLHYSVIPTVEPIVVDMDADSVLEKHKRGRPKKVIQNAFEDPDKKVERHKAVVNAFDPNNVMER